MKHCDALLVGYAVNSTSGGFTNRNVKYVDTVGIKYLYSHFYGTYCAEPVAFLQLAAGMRHEGLRIEILDGLLMGYDLEEMKQMLLRYETDVFCFSLYESSKRDVLLLMNYVKKIRPHAVVVTGGPYVTLCYRELLETEKVIDYIVVGDGDRAMPELVKAVLTHQSTKLIHNVVYRNEYGLATMDLLPKAVCMNELQPIARDFEEVIREKGFSLSIASSRGCGHAACSFCYLRQYQKNGHQPQYRYRDPQLIIDEISHLIDMFQIEKLTFVDDDFFGTNTEGMDRSERFFKMLVRNNIKLKLYMNARVASVQELIRRNLLSLVAQAGVRYFFIGFESYNDDILNRYHKGISTKDIDSIINQLNRYQIDVNPGMITFDRSIRPQQVKRNVDLLKRLHYYDLFMFTRTLMTLPSDKVRMRDNRMRHGDFDHVETDILFNALIDLRDRLYRLYGMVDRELITDVERNAIIELHFSAFYKLYEMCIGEDDGPPEEIVEECVRQVASIIKTISYVD